MAESEPERGRGGNLGIAAADPAHRKAGKRHDQDRGAGADMGEQIVPSHAAQQSERREAQSQRQ